MTHQEKEEVLREYRSKERQPVNLEWPLCFYCGGAHLSDTCRSPERDEWWRDEREAIR